MKTARFHQTIITCSIACAAVATCPMPAVAGAIYGDWVVSNSPALATWVNTSSAGTITGSSPHVIPFTDGFAPKLGPWGVPTPITTQLFTSEFDIFGGYPNDSNSVNFIFSSGYAWGTGGTLLLGNIHNFYEYTLSAWDFNGNEIDVNSWVMGTEYGGGPNSDPTGPVAGNPYISTSDTLHSADATDPLSEDFYVIDNSGSIPDLANLGQGGVFTLSGLLDVGRIQLTLTNTNLGPNGQSDDFILFNVATPVPEPSSLLLLGTGLTGLLGYGRRKRWANFHG